MARTSNTAITGTALIYLALILLVFPLRWIMAGLLAAAVHEIGHLAVLRLFGGRVGAIGITANGAYIAACGLPPWQELLCVLAGPLCGLSLLPLSRWLPRTAICAVLQSLFNLLPVYPLDGGRAVRCIAEYLPTRLGVWVCRLPEAVCLIGMLLSAGYAAFILHFGYLPLLTCIFLVYKCLRGKRPCNAVVSQLQ